MRLSFGIFLPICYGTVVLPACATLYRLPLFHSADFPSELDPHLPMGKSHITIINHKKPRIGYISSPLSLSFLFGCDSFVALMGWHSEVTCEFSPVLNQSTTPIYTSFPL